MAEKNDKARWYALPVYTGAVCSECGSLYHYHRYKDKEGFAIFCATHRQKARLRQNPHHGIVW